MTKVGFLGLGEMGGPMASHLIAAGHDVRVFDPVAAAVEARVSGGAQAASSAAEAAAEADVVCVVVRDDEQALASITAGGGVLEGAAPNTIVVLHSTVAPATVRALADACDARGVRFIDAGISGGAIGANDGTLYIMCGGDPATIADARPVLDAYSTHVVRFGEVGAGMAAKLARNLMHYQVWVAAFEGMALAEAAGLDMRAFEHLCRETAVAKGVSLQLAKQTARPIDPEGQPEQAAWIRKTVELGWKDIDDALALADDLGLEDAALMAQATRHRYGPSMSLDVAPGD